MSLDTDTRAAIVAQLATATGIPAAAQWAGRLDESTVFQPTTGTDWLRLTMQWGIERLRTLPARGGLVRRDGSTRLELYEAVDPNASVLDTLARAVLDVFPPGLTLAAGAATVQVIASRRWGVTRDGAWMKCDVDLDWAIVSQNTLT